MFEDFFSRSSAIFYHDRKIFYPLIFSLILCFFISLVLWFKMPRELPGGVMSLPLHYNVHFGVDYTGMWAKIFVLPLGALLIFLINSMIIWFVYDEGVLFSYFLSGANLFVSLATFGEAFLILLLNT